MECANTININTILQRLLEFRDARNWQQYHTEKELVRAVVTEASEIDRLYLWGFVPNDEELGEEIADTLIFLLYLCEKRSLDPLQIIGDKIDKNTVKYPIGVDHGKLKGWKGETE
jgi:NTP pyrophosphatase (non-canonical NTP hydrolase)